MSTPRPTCSTCPYYDASQKGQAWHSSHHHMIQGSYYDVIGACKRKPDASPHKTPDDWCGEHPEFWRYTDSLQRTNEESAMSELRARHRKAIEQKEHAV